MGPLFMMVRIPSEHLLKDVVDAMVKLGMPFSVAKKPEELIKMGDQQQDSQEAETDTSSPTTSTAPVQDMEEESPIQDNEQVQNIWRCEKREDGIGSDHYNFPPTPSGTTQRSSNDEGLNALQLMFPDDEEDSEDVESEDIKPQVMLEPDTINRKRSRSPNNIKRYRKQECKLCHKTYQVPFWKNKTQHAAVHSGFRRYSCSYCSKAASQVFTIRQHILKAHPSVENAGKADVGYRDLMTPEQMDILEEITRRCFPSAAK